MSSGSGPSAITVDEWQALSAQEADIVLVIDPDGLCSWSSGAAWQGRSLLSIFTPDDHPVILQLLGTAPEGPLWVRQSASGDGQMSWLHAVSTPRVGGGWVVQIRRTRTVKSESHSAAHGLDHVTGVVGRERALDEVAFLLAATPRTGKETAIACCSIDDFEATRARLGDEAANEALRLVAGRISDAVRSGDLVARLGDHELLVVLRGVHHLRGAIRVANKIRVAVEDPLVIEGAEILQTICIGVTIISRGEGVDSVLERARGALEMAQDGGHNLVMSSPPL